MKKLFIILPKESNSERELLNILAFPRSHPLGNDVSIKFLLLDIGFVQEYKDKIDADAINDEEIKQALKEKINRGNNVIIECDNTQLFARGIENNFNEICRKLSEILKNIEQELKEFKINKLSDFGEILVAAHLGIGGGEISPYLDIQSKINNQLIQINEMKNVKFVYFSSLDEPKSNVYIKKNFPLYSYQKLVENKTEEQFKMFLEILEARADKKEIEFYDTRKHILGLINSLLPVAIDCTGISELESKNLDITQYINEAFGSLSLEKYLTEKLWIEREIERKLSELSTILHGKGETLIAKTRALKETACYKDFPCRFKEFADEALKIDRFM